MKLIILVLASVIACSSAAAIFDATLDNLWEEFQQVHNKEYASAEESTRRRLTWESNLKFINQHNLEHSLGKHTFTVGMNKYGDMTNEEFVSQMNGYNMSRTLLSSTEDKHNFMKPSNVKIPDSVDWRTQGYVTPIKDQGIGSHMFKLSSINCVFSKILIKIYLFLKYFKDNAVHAGLFQRLLH